MKWLLSLATVFALLAASAAGCERVESYGGGVNASDNTAALVAAYAAIGSGDGCVEFGPGVYTFLSNGIAKSLALGQGLTIKGAGQEVSHLYFPNAGDGLVFSYAPSSVAWLSGSALNVSGLSFETGGINAGRAISLDGSSQVGVPNKMTLMQDLTFRGGSAGRSWAFGISVKDTQIVAAENVIFYGYGLNGTALSFAGTSAGTIPTQLTVHNLQATYAAVCVSVTGYVEGVEASALNCTADAKGFVFAGAGSRPQCNVINSQFATAGTAIDLINCSSSYIAGNLVFVGNANNAVGIACHPCDATVIEGNTLVRSGTGSGQYGIVVTEGSDYNTVAFNSFQGNFGGANIAVAAPSTNNKILYNASLSGTALVNTGTNTVSVGN